MPTKFMKLGFDEQVLRGLRNEDGGYVVEVGLNYYRGTPISAVERLELSVDGERVSFRATISTSLNLRSKQQRSTMRPMRPNPLIATFTAINNTSKIGRAHV